MGWRRSVDEALSMQTHLGKGKQRYYSFAVLSVSIDTILILEIKRSGAVLANVLSQICEKMKGPHFTEHRSVAFHVKNKLYYLLNFDSVTGPVYMQNHFYAKFLHCIMHCPKPHELWQLPTGATKEGRNLHGRG